MYIHNYQLFIGDFTFDLPRQTNNYFAGVFKKTPLPEPTPTEEEFENAAQTEDPRDEFVVLFNQDNNFTTPEGYSEVDVLEIPACQETILQQKIESLNIEIKDNSLHIGGEIIPLPEVAEESQVHVYEVNNQFTFTIQTGNQPQEIPATTSFESLGVYTLPSTEAAELANKKQELKAQLATYRYEQEGVGVEYNGVVIDTERDPRKVFNDTYADLKNQILEEVVWKGKTGFLLINYSDAQTIKAEIVEHISRCFYAEQEVCKEIDEATSLDGFDLSERFHFHYTK